MRIVGQFHQSDLESIEHLAQMGEEERDRLVDDGMLTKKQKLAFVFIKETIVRGIDWKLVRSVVKEVLVWSQDGDSEKVDIEIKFFHKPEEVKEFRELWFKNR